MEGMEKARERQWNPFFDPHQMERSVGGGGFGFRQSEIPSSPPLAVRHGPAAVARRSSRGESRNFLAHYSHMRWLGTGLPG